MKTFHKKFRKKIAAPPGELIHVGEHYNEEVTVSRITYDQSGFEEIEITDISELKRPADNGKISWINVNGLHNTEIIRFIGELFEIDSLVQEDILNTLHRPKMEESGDHILQIIKMLSYNEKTRDINQEQISIIMGKNYIITFQEKKGDVFDPVRERIKSGRKRINRSGADYLLYSITDAVVDNYFLVMEQIGDEIEKMEDTLLGKVPPRSLQVIQKLRKELIYLRKAVWPLREILNSLIRDESSFIKKTSLPFFRDVYDHTIQVIETSETFRDLVAGLQELYLSTVSNNMNQVMKVLTIIATIFIPLTFIAGIYGMNFEFMPELKWKAGYFIIWGLMIGVGLGMGLFFKRKNWF